MKTPAFIPTSPDEIHQLGWKRMDVIIVSGDTYIDSSYIGAAVIGRVLLEAGYRVGIIAQPDIQTDKDIARLGEPELFWGVTSGSVDSMVANYTSLGKKRKSDDLTPGGLNTRRPDRAAIVYTNLIRRYFKQTAPIVLGGIEASLRRISHYDAWSDSVRRSILVDSKADILVYGMAERTITELAEKLKYRKNIESVRGICYMSKQAPEPSLHFKGPDIQLPDHAVVVNNKDELARMFAAFYENADPIIGKRLYQRQDTRYLVQNPSQFPLSTEELDKIHEMPFARQVHPFYGKDGHVKALDTIRFSLTTHRGCYGECRFCAITVHQGRFVTSRSKASVLREAGSFNAYPDFKGIISDVGGPTANMYGYECEIKKTKGACIDKGCLFPSPCKHLPVNHSHQIRLLKALQSLDGIRKVFVGSGIRYDLILKDRKFGEPYLEELIRNHISGQLKIAPEHVQESVLNLMGKPNSHCLEAFLGLFDRLNRKNRTKVFLTYYLMAAHPGCTLEDMRQLKNFATKIMRLLPEQVQIFTPSPSTFSTLMYCTGKNSFTGKSIFVEKKTAGKQKQKELITGGRNHRV
ncbi:MAG: YgiQ family radical SAM protein [Desulfobacterales bacterium]|nr:YgiQ family radical SAM protein [Desulfobacterales bacterium]